MSKSIAELLHELKRDPWRREVGFSPDIVEAQRVLFSQAASDEQLAEATGKWLQRHQPCLFGRIAAARGFLSYCFLTESDLTKPDESIRTKIQTARSAWTRTAFEGRKSGFVILATSERLASAVPDDTVKAIAIRLAALYLLTEIKTDEALLDEVFLEKPGRSETTWKWHAGVNYFSAQGDKRWWQDHRIPSGMAFSINSVGHMVKSNILATAMSEMEASLGATPEGWEKSNVDSLSKALLFAMRTILRASVGPSGKATELLPRPSGEEEAQAPTCPIELPSDVSGFDHSQYLGHYHTDFTLPSEYFRAAVLRPAETLRNVLDFTYLFDSGIENPEYVTMGEGRPIRADLKGETPVDPKILGRGAKWHPQEIRVDENKRLMRALGRT